VGEVTITRRLRSVAARAVGRAAGDAWPLLQATAAATVAWVIARYGFDHSEPFFAPIAALVALNTVLGERGLNAMRLLQGVVVGIAVGELTLLALGGGVGSLAVSIFVATLLARALGGARIAVAQAAVAAILVVALADADAGIQRLVDALIGAGVALVFSQLLFSPEPVRLLRRAEAAALLGMAKGLGLTARALRTGDARLAEEGISVLRDLFDELADVGRMRQASHRVARRSVWRSRRALVVRESENADHLDLLGSSCLLVARVAPPLAPTERMLVEPVLTDLAGALSDLAAGLSDPATRQRVAEQALAGANRVAAVAPPPTSALAAAVLGTRLLATDLMVFAGVDVDDAVAAVREGILASEVREPVPERAGLLRKLRRWLVGSRA
jgi:uncharacterized membrane protein YgaE (UPF0421/DUF939 family)